MSPPARMFAATIGLKARPLRSYESTAFPSPLITVLDLYRTIEIAYEAISNLGLRRLAWLLLCLVIAKRQFLFVDMRLLISAVNTYSIVSNITAFRYISVLHVLKLGCSQTSHLLLSPSFVHGSRYTQSNYPRVIANRGS